MRITNPDDIQTTVSAIAETRRAVPPSRSVLVAVSGIDGSGKGYVSARLARDVDALGLRTTIINVDGWLNLPPSRFGPDRRPEHFYQHAIRFDDMFRQLVDPLRDRRSLCLEADLTDETATAYRRHVYAFDEVDVILLEGIFLLKRAFQRRYDLSCWVDCSEATALERAVSRAQEGLAAEDTIHAYRTLYFPAQVIHRERDHPVAAASLVLTNDARLGRVVR